MRAGFEPATSGLTCGVLYQLSKTQLSILAVSLFCQYLCSGAPVKKKHLKYLGAVITIVVFLCYKLLFFHSATWRVEVCTIVHSLTLFAANTTWVYHVWSPLSMFEQPGYTFCPSYWSSQVVQSRMCLGGTLLSFIIKLWLSTLTSADRRPRSLLPRHPARDRSRYPLLLGGPLWWCSASSSPASSRSRKCTSTPWWGTPHGRKMSKSLGNVIDPIDVITGITLEVRFKKHAILQIAAWNCSCHCPSMSK